MADELLMGNKTISVQTWKKVVLSMNFCSYAKQEANSKVLGSVPWLPVLASSGQCLCRDALQRWFALTEHESVAAGAHNLRQYVCVYELKFPDTGRVT